MATKNIVPRANGEGGIGTSAKRWLNGFFKNVTVDTSLTTVTPGNSDNSTKAATTAFVENTFFDKLVAKLLATTAATITSLSTSSLFYRFLAQALSVAGVQYNLSNSSAWYICLGSLFGGLIIQGGIVAEITSSDAHSFVFPVAFSNTNNYVMMVSTDAVGAFVRVYRSGREYNRFSITANSYNNNYASVLVIGW
jgi:hypothetical protein